MSRRDDERLADVVAAADAIASHLQRGRLDDGLSSTPFGSVSSRSAKR